MPAIYEYTMTEEFAIYDFEEHEGHVEVDINFTQGVNTYQTFRVFDSKSEAFDWVEKNEKICKMMKIMNGFSTEMEGYSYFGSNPGIPEDDFDEVAEEIIKQFDI